MLGDDLSFSLLDCGPVELAGVYPFDTEFLRFFQVIPEFGIEQQSFRRNTADVETGAAEESVFFNESGFQAILAGADGGGVSGRAAADDGNVVDGFGQGRPLEKR